MPYKNLEDKRRYQREWIAKRRSEYFSDKFCCVCGSTEKLELDHINPKRKITNSIWSWSEKRRNEELKKCRVICLEHHKIKTAHSKTKAPHGTHRRYVSGCRCVRCKAGHTASTTAWKRKKRRERGTIP